MRRGTGSAVSDKQSDRQVEAATGLSRLLRLHHAYHSVWVGGVVAADDAAGGGRSASTAPRLVTPTTLPLSLAHLVATSWSWSRVGVWSLSLRPPHESSDWPRGGATLLLDAFAAGAAPSRWCACLPAYLPAGCAAPKTRLARAHARRCLLS